MNSFVNHDTSIILFLGNIKRYQGCSKPEVDLSGDSPVKWRNEGIDNLKMASDQKQARKELHCSSQGKFILEPPQ